MQDPNIGRVVSVTNIKKKDFTHPYGGAPFTIRAGETLTFPWDVAEHLAKHMARSIFLEGDKSPSAYDPTRPDPNNGLGVPLWNEESEKALMTKILGESWTEARAPKKSDVELLKEEVARLNAFRESMETPPASGASRADLIAELKELGGTFVPTDTNAMLVGKIEDLKKKPAVTSAPAAPADPKTTA